MPHNLPEAPDFLYEDALARLEEAQSRMLERDDLPWAARTAAMTAVAAAERGWIPLAEKGHRTAIHAYNLAYTTDAFSEDGESEYLVSPHGLDEYIRLAESLASGQATLYSHKSLHRLRREALSLGPFGPELALKGIALAAETEGRLSRYSFTRRKAHARRSRQLGSLYAVASMGGGLPLQRVENYPEPRTVKEWIKGIRKANIV